MMALCINCHLPFSLTKVLLNFWPHTPELKKKLDQHCFSTGVSHHKCLQTGMCVSNLPSTGVGMHLLFFFVCLFFSRHTTPGNRFVSAKIHGLFFSLGDWLKNAWIFTSYGKEVLSDTEFNWLFWTHTNLYRIIQSVCRWSQNPSGSCERWCCIMDVVWAQRYVSKTHILCRAG